MTHRIASFARSAVVVAALAALTACSSAPVTRNVTPDPKALETEVSATPASAAVLRDFSVVGVNVTIPATLVVNEANSYYPNADVVWHGDAPGDRRAQVKAIMEDGLSAGVKAFTGQRKVVVDVVLTRFHSLSQRARYTIGGVHAIQFHMRVRDAATGEILIPSYHVKADFRAYGGAVAVAAEARGETQKVRILQRLSEVIQAELRRPGTTVPTDTGVFGAINQI